MAEIIELLRSELAGRYEVVRQVGEGGMATVFLARDLKHQRDVAIKVLRSELSATIGTERFDQEIEIAARLQHPHILPVYDSGNAGGALYYMMPFVEGHSLKERLEEGSIPTNEALRIGREVASALDYAHRQGVVHRDIKPANILISQGHAVVADFGIARAATTSTKQARGLTQIGTTVGTPWYMSPEQAVADPNVDGRSDIYALGCVMFELLEGSPPFDGDSPQAVIAQTVSAPVPELKRALRETPTAVPAAVRKALAKNPNDRYQTAGEFEKALEYGTGDIALSQARQTGRPLVVAGLVVALVLAAIGGFALRGFSSAAVAEGADVIAVLPFNITGADPDLGEGMVALLSTNLNAVGTLRTVDARTVLQRWRSRGGANGLDLEGSLQVGRDVNASSVLMGTVVQAGSGVRLNAQLMSTSGEELARVQIDGSAEDIIGLVDTLSLEVLHEVWRSKEPMPSFDVAAITSGSIDAVRAYIRGRAFLRRAQWDSAEAAYREAISLDSTFALAHLELSEAYGWTGHGGESQVEAVANATRYASRLPPREQEFVAAIERHRRQESGAIDSIRAYTRRYPSDPRGWYALGDAQHHSRGLVLLTPEEALAPFDRAIELDSSYIMALIHPMEIAIREGDREAFRRYAEINDRAGGPDRALPVAETAVWGDSASSVAAWDSLLRTNLTTAQMALGGAVTANPDALIRGLRYLEVRLRENPNLINLRFGYAMVALATGRLSALEETVAAYEAHEDSGINALGALLRVLAVLGGQEPSTFADSASIEPLLQAQSTEARGFVSSMLAITTGDTVPARRFISTNRGDLTDGVHLLLGMDGWIALIRGDTASGIEKLQTAIDSLSATELGGDQIRNVLYLQLARALAMQPETHSEGMMRLRYGMAMENAPEMIPAAYIAAAEAAEAMGHLDIAIEYYSKFVQLWSAASPELQPQVEDIRSRIATLTRQLG